MDATLQAFAGEVSALAHALGLVDQAFRNSRLRDLGTSANHKFVNEVSQSLRTLLTDCEDILVKLDSIIQSASKAYRNTIFRKSVTALRLDFKSASIAQVRQQIQSYNAAMQMTLSMLNM